MGFHKDEDLARTASAARAPMRPAGHIDARPEWRRHDVSRRQRPIAGIAAQGQPASGKNYIGPPGDAGGAQDREIVSFDGRTMVLKWMDPEVAGRYGTGVYVRCAAEGTARVPVSRPMKPKAQ